MLKILERRLVSNQFLFLYPTEPPQLQRLIATGLEGSWPWPNVNQFQIEIERWKLISCLDKLKRIIYDVMSAWNTWNTWNPVDVARLVGCSEIIYIWSEFFEGMIDAVCLSLELWMEAKNSYRNSRNVTFWTSEHSELKSRKTKIVSWTNQNLISWSFLLASEILLVCFKDSQEHAQRFAFPILQHLVTLLGKELHVLLGRIKRCKINRWKSKRRKRCLQTFLKLGDLFRIYFSIFILLLSRRATTVARLLAKKKKVIINYYNLWLL